MKQVTGLIKWFGIHDLIFFISIVCILQLDLEAMTAMPSFGFQIESGREILELGTIPSNDTFLSISRSWIRNQWLGEVLIALFERIGGWSTLYAACSCVFFISFFALLYRALGMFIKDSLIALFICFLAGKLLTWALFASPLLFAFPCFIVVVTNLFFLARQIKASAAVDGRFKRSIVWILIALFFWANIHPSFILGVLLCFLLPVSLSLDKLLLGRKFQIPRLSLEVLCLFSILVTFINPYGIKLYDSLLLQFTSDEIRSYLSLWQPTSFRTEHGHIIEIFIAVFAATLFVNRGRELQFGFFELIVLGGLFYGAMRALIFVPFFVIAFVVPLAESIEVSKRILWDNKVLSVITLAWENIMQRENATKRGQLTVALCCIVVLCMAVREGKIPFYTKGYLTESNKSFMQAIKYLAKDSENEGAAVFSGFLGGGKIIFYSERKLKPFWDVRLELFGEEFIKESGKQLSYSKDWKSFIINTGANFVITNNESFISRQLNRTRTWPLVKKFGSKKETVFIYRVPAKEA